MFDINARLQFTRGRCPRYAPLFLLPVFPSFSLFNGGRADMRQIRQIESSRLEALEQINVRVRGFALSFFISLRVKHETHAHTLTYY